MLRFFLILLVFAMPLAARADPVLETVLAAPNVHVGGMVLDQAALNALYTPRKFEPLWLDGRSLGAKGQAAVKLLEASARHGLNPADYDLDEIKARMASSERSELIVLDLLISDGLMRYVADLKIGRVSPRKLQGERFQRPPTVDPAETVRQATEAPNFEAFMAAIEPPSPIYHGLVKVLADLRAQKPWPAVPAGLRIDPGAVSSRIVKLRERLAASNELGAAPIEGKKYDAPLVEAVKAFQARHGLDADGVIGQATLATLNVSLETRLNQVLADMERLRWRPAELGNRYVVVNVPAFELAAFENGQVALNMRTVVGRSERKTPIFSDAIRYLEFNPNWHVPPTIVKEDIIPHLVEDPHYAIEHKNVYLFQNGVEIDPATVDWTKPYPADYRFRAPPGPLNPLGRVKFMFPNRFDVYLHDTSEPKLFEDEMRAASSGCIRIQDPQALTQWILKDKDGWSEEKREKILASEKQTRVELPEPVPVYLIYVTAWLGEDGLPAFRDDVYGYDKALAVALAEASAKPRRLAASMARGALDKPVVDPVSDPTQKVEIAAP